jgi:hypothetical protein
LHLLLLLSGARDPGNAHFKHHFLLSKMLLLLLLLSEYLLLLLLFLELLHQEYLLVWGEFLTVTGRPANMS